MSQVKLLKKYIGNRVVLLDGTKTTVKSLLATAFKLESGDKVKPESLKLLANGTLKEQSAAKAAKPAAKAKAKASAKSSESKRGRKPEYEIDGDYSKAQRRACTTFLVGVGILADKKQGKAYSPAELREMIAEYQEEQGGGKKKTKAKKAKAEPTPTKTKTKTKSAKAKTVKPSDFDDDEFDSPVIEKRRPKRKVEIEGKVKKSKASDIAAKAIASTKAKLSKVKEATVKTKKRLRDAEVKLAKELNPLAYFDDAVAQEIVASLMNKIGGYIAKTTGYDLAFTSIRAMRTHERMSLTIGLLPTDASDAEIAEYDSDLNNVIQVSSAAFDDDALLNDLDAELDSELGAIGQYDDDEADDQDVEDEALDDLGELEETIEEEDDDAEEEEEEDGEDEESGFSDLMQRIDINTLAHIRKVGPRFDALLKGWYASKEVIESFGDEVEPGTVLVSNKSGELLTVVGFDEELEKVVLIKESGSTTRATIATVIRMDFAEDVSDEEEEEYEEEDYDDGL